MFEDKHTHEQHFQNVGQDLSGHPSFIKFGFGYTLALNDSNLCNDIRRDPGVLLVDTNEAPIFIGSVRSEDVEYDARSLEGNERKRYTQNTATGARYGLQMLAAKGKLPTPVKNYGTYDYIDSAGQGVNVYVFDSGIRVYVFDSGIRANDPDYARDTFKLRGSIINFSLGWQGDRGAIVAELILAEAAGIKVYAAAGNDGIDAGNTIPCANAQTACIAAVDNKYQKAWFSSSGSAVDYLAPGDDIVSLDCAHDNALKKKWGTSMATAHASGAAAVFAFWQGLVNDQTKHWHDYVWWNSLPGLATGFSGTKNTFINTGIHSSKKNQEADDSSIQATPALNEQLTTFATAFSRSTVFPMEGMTMEPALDTSSVVAALSAVEFSFDPTTSAAAATAT